MNNKMLNLNEENKDKNIYTNSFGYDLKTNYIYRKSNILEITNKKDIVSLKKG